MNATHPETPPNAAEAFLCSAVQGLQTLALQKRGLCQPPRHRAILQHGQQQSQRFHVKPAPMPQTFTGGNS